MGLEVVVVYMVFWMWLMSNEVMEHHPHVRKKAPESY
jgi:hypothetical protein